MVAPPAKHLVRVVRAVDTQHALYEVLYDVALRFLKRKASLGELRAVVRAIKQERGN